MAFGTELEQLMQEKQQTVASLAVGSGLTTTTIRRLLRYELDPQVRPPKSAVLRRVASALKVKPSRLFRMAGYLIAEGE